MHKIFVRTVRYRNITIIITIITQNNNIYNNNKINTNKTKTSSHNILSHLRLKETKWHSLIICCYIYYQNIDIRFIEYMPFDGNRWKEGRMLPYSEVLKVVKSSHPSLTPIPLEADSTSKVGVCLNELIFLIA